MAIESISCQVRTARKLHQCELCLCPIHKGEEYGYEVLKVYGKIEANKRNLECDELTAKDEFQTEDYGLRYTSETFYRAVYDYIHLHHNGEDDWAGSMFSRVIKILNELNAYEYIDLGNYEI